MGTQAHLLVVGGPSGLVEAGRRRVMELHRRWSRFEQASEVSRLNAAQGEPQRVSAETRTLVACAVLGWQRTGGRFDPTVHEAVVAAGYDRDFALLDRFGPGVAEPTSSPPGCAGITVDDQAGTVHLPVGVRFDPGGIGKGLAADVAVDELLALGGEGVCVNLGGDLRVAGAGPDGEAWRVDVPDPRSGLPWGQLRLREGAVATSSTCRSWTRGGEALHHLIDPRTGTPAETGVRGVTVVAATAWEAEVAAKAALLAGAAGAAAAIAGTASGAVLFEDSGRTVRVGRIDDYVAFGGWAA
jgi:FAD:protein FMN transferase